MEINITINSKATVKNHLAHCNALKQFFVSGTVDLFKSGTLMYLIHKMYQNHSTNYQQIHQTSGFKSNI